MERKAGRATLTSWVVRLIHSYTQEGWVDNNNNMGTWSDDSTCCVVHDVRLYSVLDTVLISGEDVCCSVVFGTLVGGLVFSVMWSELLMTCAISCPMWSLV